MTRKLYYENPYLKKFTASILETGHEEGMDFVVLDQTAFYPTGGGQPCDLGTIQGVAVVKVEETEGKIRHWLSAPLIMDDDGEKIVSAEIDWERRFDHMQQHAGQHVLSAAFDEWFQIPTVGFHLGREVVTIDLAAAELSQSIIERAEHGANQIVFENRPITARFVEPDELKRLPLRKPPKVTDNIRLVIVEDFDYNPCGGTHPMRTGEIGPIKVIRSERYKGSVRLEFVCGWRAFKKMSGQQQTIRIISRELNCSEGELESQFTRLLSEKQAAEQSLSEAKMRLLQMEAKELTELAEPLGDIRLIRVVTENRSVQEMQNLARLTAAGVPNAVVLAAIASGIKTQFVFAKSPGVSLNMKDTLIRSLQSIDGKGGGTAYMAQGGGSGSISAEEVLASAVELIRSELITAGSSV